MEEDMHRVELRPWEYEHAAEVGIRRFTANWSRADAEYYKPEYMEDDRTAQVAAAVAECAVARWTNKYWHAGVWPVSDHKQWVGLADVGDNIEVRRVRNRHNGAAVRKHQVGQGLELWVAYPEPPEFRTVEVLGWLDYDMAWDDGKPSHYAPETTRLISEEMLNDPNDH